MKAEKLHQQGMILTRPPHRDPFLEVARRAAKKINHPSEPMPDEILASLPAKDDMPPLRSTAVN